MRRADSHRRGRRLVGLLSGCLVGLAAAWAPGFDLDADRDAFTPSAFSVAEGRGLVEGSQVYIDNQTGLPTNNYPELLVRHGATDWFEWRLGANYGVGSQGNIVTSVEVGEGTLDGSTLYESSLLYGFKAATSKQDGLLPDSCFIMEASTPTYGDLFGTVPVATAVAGWELGHEWRIDGAIRYAYSEAHAGWFSRWTPSVVLRAPLTERFEVHAEWFGSYTQGLAQNVQQPFFSPGFHYGITRRVEMGLRVGWGLASEAAPFFSDAGIAIQY